jgi:hypothetical protein
VPPTEAASRGFRFNAESILAGVDVAAAQIVAEFLSLRRSHPDAPAADVLDLAMKRRSPWIEDFLDHMVPPAPFALLVAEAVDDCMTCAERRGLTGPTADARVRDALVRLYRESVWPKFVRRYGLSYPAVLVDNGTAHPLS